MEHEAKDICVKYNIPITEFKIAKNVEEAKKFAGEIGFPVVLKILSPQIIHKSDVGGVKLNLRSSQEVELAYQEILKNVKVFRSKAKILGILVQEMAPKSTEVIVGAIKDSQFGPSIMFGLGGIFVELLEDVVFRVAPITKQEATSMIREIKAFPVLNGYRNSPPLDINSISDIIYNISRLIMDYQEIKELDLNPILVYKKGAKTVDARIILE